MALGAMTGLRLVHAHGQTAVERIEAMLPREADLGRTQRLYQLDDLRYRGHSTFSIGDNYSRQEWGWVAAASRWFVAGRAAPDDANVIKVSIHEFSAMPERDEALRAFIADRVGLDGFSLREPAEAYPDRPRLARVDGGSASTLMLDCTDRFVVEVEGTGLRDPSFDVGGIMRRCMERVELGWYEEAPVPTESFSGDLLFGWANASTWRGSDWIVCCRWWMGQTADLRTPLPFAVSLRVVNRGPDVAMFPADQFRVVESTGSLVTPNGDESLFFDLDSGLEGVVAIDPMEPLRVYEIGLRYLAIPSGDTIEVDWSPEGIRFSPYMINR